MNKKLKIQFWRAEKALAMQILEQHGLPKCKEDGFIKIVEFPWIHGGRLWLRGSSSLADWDVEKVKFDTNPERDAYLNKVVNAITDELFAGEGELKLGEMCKVRNSESGKWEKRKLLAILPEQYEKRFIVETKDYSAGHSSWTFARPIVKRIEPKIEECGNVVTYTWEEK